jgi:hypothetical protein
MKKLLLILISLLALTASAEVVFDNTTEYDGHGAPGFSYPAPKTISDLTSLIDYLIDPYPILPEWLPAMDMNGDDDINLDDVTWLEDYLMGNPTDPWWDDKQVQNNE